MSKIIDKLALVYIKDGKMLMTRTYGKDVFYNLVVYVKNMKQISKL